MKTSLAWYEQTWTAPAGASNFGAATGPGGGASTSGVRPGEAGSEIGDAEVRGLQLGFGVWLRVTERCFVGVWTRVKRICMQLR